MVVVALSWVLSSTSCVMLWSMGNKSVGGPRIGLANQLLWIAYCVLSKQWVLLPGVAAYTAIHVRNLVRWEKEGS